MNGSRRTTLGPTTGVESTNWYEARASALSCCPTPPSRRIHGWTIESASSFSTRAGSRSAITNEAKPPQSWPISLKRSTPSSSSAASTSLANCSFS